MRRPKQIRFKCGHPGCQEWASYEYDTRADAERLERMYTAGRWRCVRHSAPETVLMPDNPRRSIEITSRQETHGRYFGVSGFLSGPGFKIFADDFPVGTRLRVTAEIILPDAPDEMSA